MDPSSDPASIGELLSIASAHHRRGSLDEADRLYTRILETSADNVRALLLKGVLERERGDVGASLEYLSRADQCSENDPEVIGQLAVSYMAANDLVKADGLLRRVLEIDPQAAQALANLGALLQHRGLLREAAKMHRNYLELEPDDLEVHCNLANALADAGEGLQALVHVDAVLDRFADHPLLLAARGSVLCSLERFADAIEPLERALAAQPSDDMAWINLAFARRRLGETAAARTNLQSALRINPDNARATTDLANLHLKEGEAAEACALCEKFLLHHVGERLVLGTYPYALRAAGRERAADELLDYQQLIGVTDLAEAEEINHSLAQSLIAHPSLLRDPVSKSTRGGAQTGELDVDSVPGLSALVEQIDARIEDYISRLAQKIPAGHPALSVATECWSLRIWATVLESGGCQSPHMHPLAWLSGVYYVSLPTDISKHDRDAGQLEFGLLPDRIGVSGERYEIEPREGRLVLFPSYFYHSTRLFTSSDARISIAFDVMPQHSSLKDY